MVFVKYLVVLTDHLTTLLLHLGTHGRNGLDHLTTPLTAPREASVRWFRLGCVLKGKGALDVVSEVADGIGSCLFISYPLLHL